MSLNVSNDSLIYKSNFRLRNQSIYDKSDKGHLMRTQSKVHFKGQDCSTAKRKDKLHYSMPKSVQDQSVNKSVSTTAVRNYSGRLSFGQSKINLAVDKFFERDSVKKFLGAIARNKATKGFIKLANEKILVCEALMAALINCTLRPASIMIMPADDPEKNKKAAAHSVASGIIGLLLAIAITYPVKGALKGVYQNPEKYLKEAKDFYCNAAKEVTKDGKKLPSLQSTSEKLFSKIFEFSMLPVRAALTVALVPIIDKHIISKVFGPVKDKKNDFMAPIYFKGSNPNEIESSTEAFKNFRQGKARIK